MVFVRRRPTRRPYAAKKTFRKKMTYQRKNRYALSRTVNVRNDVHYFKRHFAQISPGSFVGSGTYLPYLNAYSFNLAQLPNYTEYTALFDKFMISHIQLRFYLNIDPAAQSAVGASYPKLYYCNDHDDAVAPTTLNDLREHTKCKEAVLYPNKCVKVNIKPAVLAEIYRSAGNVTWTSKWRQFIDCAQPTTPHYGLKWGIDNFTNTNYTLNIEGTMWFACKDAR